MINSQFPSIPSIDIEELADENHLIQNVLQFSINLSPLSTNKGKLERIQQLFCITEPKPEDEEEHSFQNDASQDQEADKNELVLVDTNQIEEIMIPVITEVLISDQLIQQEQSDVVFPTQHQSDTSMGLQKNSNCTSMSKTFSGKTQIMPNGNYQSNQVLTQKLKRLEQFQTQKFEVGDLCQVTAKKSQKRRLQISNNEISNQNVELARNLSEDILKQKKKVVKIIKKTTIKDKGKVEPISTKTLNMDLDGIINSSNSFNFQSQNQLADYQIGSFSADVNLNCNIPTKPRTRSFVQNSKARSQKNFEFKFHMKQMKDLYAPNQMIIQQESNESSNSSSNPNEYSGCYYPDFIMKDQFERKKILNELQQLSYAYKAMHQCLEINIRKQPALQFPKTVPCKILYFQGFSIMIFILDQKTIVFDMDETLVKVQKRNYKLPQYDEVIQFKFLSNKDIKMYLQFRPYLRQMLKKLSKHFELIVYTSGEPEYAKAAINAIEAPQSYFQYRLTKENCIKVSDLDYHSKDLRILLSNRSIKDIIIVENQISNFMLQIHNEIPVKEFNGDKNDKSLQSLCSYLMTFLDVNDVRDKIQQDFNFTKLVTNSKQIPTKNLQQKTSLINAKQAPSSS